MLDTERKKRNDRRPCPQRVYNLMPVRRGNSYTKLIQGRRFRRKEKEAQSSLRNLRRKRSQGKIQEELVNEEKS